ncbi:hypothetical protein P3W24_13340 [Luteibacter sp. PPL201]|uniref:HNH endonuclease n=1 Tax=Luteibacter sahnii TaxID=3021977 RepID=A0ABT6BCU8_9GAMM
MQLPRPEVDDLRLIEKVVAERQNGRNRLYFAGIEDAWKRRAQQYLAAGGNPEVVKPWPDVAEQDVKTRYLTLYNSPDDDAVQKAVLEKLRERTLQLCPACGEDGTPNTLDHYLPKDDYPEFSILAANLFPMCDICQGHKGTDTLDDMGRRLFLHPYFDQLLNQQVMQLKMGLPFASPKSMTLEAHDDLCPTLKPVVSRHLENLQLESRYNHYFRDEHVRLLGNVTDIREAELDVTQQLVLFRNNARRKSINSWGHIFYDAVLRNNALMNFLALTPLPLLSAS